MSSFCAGATVNSAIPSNLMSEKETCNYARFRIVLRNRLRNPAKLRGKIGTTVVRGANPQVVEPSHQSIHHGKPEHMPSLPPASHQRAVTPLAAHIDTTSVEESSIGFSRGHESLNEKGCIL